MRGENPPEAGAAIRALLNYPAQIGRNAAASKHPNLNNDHADVILGHGYMVNDSGKRQNIGTLCAALRNIGLARPDNQPVHQFFFFDEGFTDHRILNAPAGFMDGFA